MTEAQSISAADLLDALHDAGVTDVVAVPDTHQRSLIELLQADDAIRFIQTTTEDEAVALGAGLIVGGRRPVLQIQHAGLYACVNNLRGVAIDGEFPLVLLIGLLGRDPAKPPRHFVRSLVGLDRSAAQSLFSEFLNNQSLTTSQIRFVEMVIDQLTARGVMEASALYEAPFSNLHAGGPDELFAGKEKVISGIFEALQFAQPEIRVGTG